MKPIEMELLPADRKVSYLFEFEARSCLNTVKELLEDIKKPFIFNGGTLNNEFFITDYEGNFSIRHAINDILSMFAGETNLWKTAEIICDKDEEWGKWRNEGLTGEFYYKFILKDEYIEKLSQILLNWKNEIESVVKKISDTENKEKAEKEQRKQSLSTTVISKKTVKGSDGYDFVALVSITDGKETTRLWCRNIFDVGFVINPEEGGLFLKDNDNKLIVTNMNDSTRPATEFEERCLEYIAEFPPIPTEMRM